jgi:hypothetical protein
VLPAFPSFLILENFEMSETNFVTSEELVARGISADAQRRGRHRGDLLFTSVGGDRYAYRTADVETWLQRDIEINSKTGGASRPATAPAAQTSPTSGQVPRPINGARQTAAAGRPAWQQSAEAGKPAWSAAAGGAKGQWQSAVARHTDAGMSRADAVQAVDASHPGLREAMLAEHNAR